MQRLVEEHGETQEFSQQRLLDEDESMKQELSRMKVSYAAREVGYFHFPMHDLEF
jgi:hypothetical protein